MTDLPGLDDPIDPDDVALIYHRDGTRALTRREGYTILENRFKRKGNPDAGSVAFTRWGKRSISTVFLGIDHSFDKSGPPIIFESMLFDATQGMGEEDMDRYATEEEAKAGHLQMVERHFGRLAALIYRTFPWYVRPWPVPWWERLLRIRGRRRRET